MNCQKKTFKNVVSCYNGYKCLLKSKPAAESRTGKQWLQTITNTIKRTQHKKIKVLYVHKDVYTVVLQRAEIKTTKVGNTMMGILIW